MALTVTSDLISEQRRHDLKKQIVKLMVKQAANSDAMIDSI